MSVEQLIKEYNGSTHWGKYYSSNTKNIEIPQSFKDYRANIDPSIKFMNSYTTELITGIQNDKRYDKPAISKKGILWRSLWWITFVAAILSSTWHITTVSEKRKPRKDIKLQF